MDLKTYFKTASQAELARELGVTPSAVNQWVNGLMKVAADKCPSIERVTAGLVRCEDLRPDVEWHVLRNAPNPVDAQQAAAAAEPAVPGVACGACNG